MKTFAGGMANSAAQFSEEFNMLHPVIRKAVSHSAIPGLLFAALISAVFAAGAPGPYAGLQWRSIGPSRGGRVLAVTGVVQQPQVFYFGAVVGGVWKTEDAGASWQPIFDKQPIASIGAIAVAPSDPNVIYVGTGESALREDISFGDGVYKSTDAGKTWQHMGLTDTRHIGKIIVDPHNPDMVLVAAVGHAYGPNQERGVFRSTDGGKTWKKVLYQNQHTGAVDLSFDPENPRIVYAAAWQVQRTPWHLESGGPGSGLYKSTDEGVTWKRLEGNGLPEGVWGRVGVSAAGGDRVYSLIDAKQGGLYRSDDGGAHWQRVSDDARLMERPWYFTRVHADPKNPNVVYVCNTGFYRSMDAGATFHMVRAPHGDNHGLWIDPADPTRMIIGNDGGASVTVNDGKTWSTQLNQPTAQFYHVAVDNRFPYYVYGAQQDNESVAVPSRSDYGPITEHDWYVVSDNESGYVVPDPSDPDIVYSGSYFGILTRYNRHTGQFQDVSPWPFDFDGHTAAEAKYRFTWTMPLVFSPQNPHVMYHGSQYLLRSDDGGMSWTAISPDLTRNDKSKQGPSGGPITLDDASAEYYDLIYTIAPSALSKGLIWVGTDDGLIQLTRDGGKHWQNVTPKGMPAWAKVSLIEASHFDPGTAYAAVDAHKLDNFNPYIFVTHDYGRSWARADQGIRAPAYVHAVREDPVQKNLLYAGTETGVYVSYDGGKNWRSLRLNLPVTSVRDLVVKNGDLVIATHGRGFWILDDILPLREIAVGVNPESDHLYATRTAVRLRPMDDSSLPYVSVGQNPPNGAILYYSLAANSKATVSMEIHDAAGRLVRAFSSIPQPLEDAHPLEFPTEKHEKPEALMTTPGLHRVVWNLRYAAPHDIPGAYYDSGGPVSPMVLPGSYTVTLKVGDKSYSQPLKVITDPRVEVTDAALKQQFDLMMKLNQAVAEEHAAANAIRGVRGQLAALQTRLAGNANDQSLAKSAADLDAKLAGMLEMFYQYRAHAEEAQLNYPTELNSQLAYLEVLVDSADSAPTAQQQAMYLVLRKNLDEALAKWNTLRDQDIPAFNARLQQAGVGYL
ncbi:MAG: glycosyl hydrolase, partial [Gammaproteobacteria bacterium]|nr:glycosyl hydrolase [Gammaproteobacteria bacterium]